jgi:hypothetical protein
MPGARWGRVLMTVVLVLVILSLILSMPGLVPR